MSSKFIMLSLVSVALGAATARADVYQIDAYHTSVGFSIRHMVINNVQGSFKEFTGMVEYDGKDLATLKASGNIKAASIDTGIQQRDDHLRSPDFFEVDKYPEITFVGKKVEKKDGNYVLVGDFTMHGVTKEIELPLTVSGPITDPQGKQRIGLETGLTVNRKDYGINWSKVMDNGGLVVGDEVKI